ncbi:MAG: hypothetical protein ACOCUI_04640 [bacterium]
MTYKNNLIGEVMYLILLFVVTIISIMSFIKAVYFMMADNLVGILFCFLINGSLFLGMLIIWIMEEENDR